MSAIRALMSRAIDYAGLFPPASLTMAHAVRNYARHRASDDAWVLGNFVVPLERLKEFDATAAGLHVAEPFRLSVILPGPEFDSDALKEGLAFGRVMSAEVRVTEPEHVSAVASLAPAGIDNYFEIPPKGDHMDLLNAIAAEEERAKLRTGGTDHGSIPSPVDVANFLSECLTARVGFKATAGLHHVIRGEYPLTYEAGAPVEVMHGFLNVLLAAAAVFRGATADEALDTIEEARAEAFRFSEDAVEWGGRRITVEELRLAREQFAISFGSCSFDEPLADLRALGLI